MFSSRPKNETIKQRETLWLFCKAEHPDKWFPLYTLPLLLYSSLPRIHCSDMTEYRIQNTECSRIQIQNTLSLFLALLYTLHTEKETAGTQYHEQITWQEIQQNTDNIKHIKMEYSRIQISYNRMQVRIHMILDITEYR